MEGCIQHEWAFTPRLSGKHRPLPQPEIELEAKVGQVCKLDHVDHVTVRVYVHLRNLARDIRIRQHPFREYRIAIFQKEGQMGRPGGVCGVCCRPDRHCQCIWNM